MNLRFIDFPASSAVFHITKGLLFNRLIAFKVRSIIPDENNKNIEIHNKPRLKERLFERIKDKYNARLRATSKPSEYNFKDEYKKKMLIKDEKLDIFELKLFQVSGGIEDDLDLRDIGGDFVIYPMTFVCKNLNCGDLQVIKYKDIDKFNPKKCKRKGCNGEYEQLSLMLFCETCGNVRPFEYSYKNEEITLIRESKDSISTWKVRAKTQPPIDVFRLMCNHIDPHDKGPYNLRQRISSSKPTQQTPLTVTEGSIYIPVTETNIDIPTAPDIEMGDLEYILNAIALDLFPFLSVVLKKAITLEIIQKLYEGFNNDTVKEMTYNIDPMFQGISDDEKEKKWKEKFFIDKIEYVIKDLKQKYPKEKRELLREINDFHALTGRLGLSRFETVSFQQYVDEIIEPIKKSNKIREFNKIKTDYYIDNLIYVPNVTLINACYGVINGIYKFYEEGFVPHFNPIWKNLSDPSKGFYAYCYPYETEGIILQLNKIKICEWLKENEIISEIPIDVDDFFSSIQFGDRAYKEVSILLHTLSHLLMRNSSLYTGLDLQSYGEKIFPTTAAIFFYSSSSINIGGLQFIFENELFNWFEGIKYDVRECTLDPNCIKEKGACFACMYVPEFVCKYFNQDLNRDVFLGKVKYKKGFWK
ncbi:MAG: hypothetical protein JXA99_00185 [Candidatus Lokiarchaeota archaeon]|nr:hypothetical protein [Candidatus Lokiarchaeota archaeon]